MAADGYGSKGEPEFDDGGAPDTAVDPTLVGQYAGIVGNRVAGTSTQRAAFTAIWSGFSSGPWDGLVFHETDTKQTYERRAGAWVCVTPGLSCALRKSANQNLTTSAAALTWDVEISDAFAMHDNSSNTSRVSAPVSGVYEVVVSAYNSNTSGMGTLYGRLNGTTDIPGSLARGTGDSTAGLPLRSVFSLSMSAGDYIEIMVLHATAAGNIAGGTSTGAAVMSMKRIG